MGKIIIGGGIQPTTQDTPGDLRTRVETFSEIANIDNPYRGMLIYVVDEDREYRVKKLASKVIGGIEVPNSAIDIEDAESVRPSSEETKKDIFENAEYDESTGTLTLF